MPFLHLLFVEVPFAQDNPYGKAAYSGVVSPATLQTLPWVCPWQGPEPVATNE